MALETPLLAVLHSLHSQQPPPDRVVLHVPKLFTLWPNATVTIPSGLRTLPWLTINRPNADYGPATKVLGLRDLTRRSLGSTELDLTSEDVIVVTDDDKIRPAGWLAPLVQRTTEMRAVAAYNEPGREPGMVQGYLGWAFRVGSVDWERLHRFYASQRDACELVDDHMMTGYLTNARYPISMVLTSSIRGTAAEEKNAASHVRVSRAPADRYSLTKQPAATPRLADGSLMTNRCFVRSPLAWWQALSHTSRLRDLSSAKDSRAATSLQCRLRIWETTRTDFAFRCCIRCCGLSAWTAYKHALAKLGKQGVPPSLAAFWARQTYMWTRYKHGGFASLAGAQRGKLNRSVASSRYAVDRRAVPAKAGRYALVSTCIHGRGSPLHPWSRLRFSPAYVYASMRNKRAYCQQHGVDCWLFTERASNWDQMLGNNTNAKWDKLVRLLEVVNSSRRYDWVLWLDCDAVVANKSCSLSSFATQAALDCHRRRLSPASQRPPPLLVYSADWNGRNTGAFLLRGGSESAELLNRWLAGAKYVDARRGIQDQRALSNLIERDAWVASKMCLLDRRGLNGYPNRSAGLQDSKHFEQKERRAPWVYERGDWIYHDISFTTRYERHPVEVQFTSRFMAVALQTERRAFPRPLLMLTSTVVWHAWQARQTSYLGAANQPGPRAAMYRDVIARWLHESNLPILLAENQGFDWVRDLKSHGLGWAVAIKRVESSVFNDTNVVAKLIRQGHVTSANAQRKGYREFLSMQHALQTSVLAKHSSVIIKLTGKYFLPDFETFLWASYRPGSVMVQQWLEGGNNCRKGSSCKCHTELFVSPAGSTFRRLVDLSFGAGGMASSIEQIFGPRVKQENHTHHIVRLLPRFAVSGRVVRGDGKRMSFL